MGLVLRSGRRQLLASETQGTRQDIGRDIDRAYISSYILLLYLALGPYGAESSIIS